MLPSNRLLGTFQAVGDILQLCSGLIQVVGKILKIFGSPLSSLLILLIRQVSSRLVCLRLRSPLATRENEACRREYRTCNSGPCNGMKG